MIARRSVWSDARVATLLEAFVPVADEVGRLQRGQDRECRFFQSFAEQGHYGGRSEPSNTRQGIYAIAPSGAFLASINTRSPAQMADMLERALAAWEALPHERRLQPLDPAVERAQTHRYEARFPAGGVVLRVTARDLPRAEPPAGRRGDWRPAAWNEDWAWLRPDEVRSLCAPEPLPAPGESWPVPGDLARRIARAQLVDFVRGQTVAYRDEEVERAELRVTLERIEGDVLHLRLAGSSRTHAVGRWKTSGFERPDEDQVRGLELDWSGYAHYDRAAGRLARLELICAGLRTGATQFNGRDDDPGPAPIGFHFELTDVGPEQLVAPAQLWAYRW